MNLDAFSIAIKLAMSSNNKVKGKSEEDILDLTGISVEALAKIKQELIKTSHSVDLITKFFIFLVIFYARVKE